MERLRGSISYANVVATLALIIAMAGGAYAAGLGRDSVKSKHIKDGQVKSQDVRDNGLTGTDVDEGSLGKVPSAASADSADTAANAGDAGTLDGLDSTGLVRAFGANVDDTANSPLVFSVPEMQMELLGDSSPASTAGYRVRNNSSGTLIVSDLIDQTSSKFSVVPGGTSGDRADDGPLVAVSTAHPDVMLVFNCVDATRLYCFGQLISAPAN
jgi:hypothetical protein